MVQVPPISERRVSERVEEMRGPPDFSLPLSLGFLENYFVDLVICNVIC